MPKYKVIKAASPTRLEIRLNEFADNWEFLIAYYDPNLRVHVAILQQ